MITNKCIFAGTVFKNNGLAMTTNNKKVCAFTVSVKVGRDQQGKGLYEYINCRAYEGRAEVVAKYFAKGKAILIDSHCHTYAMDTENGKKYVTEFIVDDVGFVPTDYQAEDAPQQVAQAKPQTVQYGQPLPDNLDLPF